VSVISKFVGWLVVWQLVKYLMEDGLLPGLQSAYYAYLANSIIAVKDIQNKRGRKIIKKVAEPCLPCK